LVETRQSTKAAATLLNKIYKDQTRIVYVKAGNVSDFRQKYNILKCREVNNFHHAKDAYLNIVVGNVYDAKFTENPYHYMKDASYRDYSLNRMYDFDIVRNNKSSWITGDCGTIQIIQKIISKNNVLFTRHATTKGGAISDQTIERKRTGKANLLPVKKGLPPEKYGCYNSLKRSYFILVRHKKGQKLVKTIVPVYIHLEKKIADGSISLEEYCKNVLGLNEPKILISKIKIDSLIEIDGYRMHISGQSESQILAKNAHQLIINKNNEHYLRNIVKYINRCETTKEELPLTKYDNISEEKNLLLFNQLLNKINNTIFKSQLNAERKVLTENREKFTELNIYRQCKLLLEIVHLFQCNSTLANLTNIEGSKYAGKIRFSQNISNFKKVKFINQSPTGLFEQSVDLVSL
jgi:CRISPR-associated endonuclease Csn1